ncbi:MAG: DUF2177 family protein [Acidimicrobiia bacterium]|nr:DUF2177 family protein [Acidimicrobiia bacterium]
MTTFLARLAVGAGAFVVLDGLWLGVVMKRFYREQLAPIVRMADGGMAPNWSAAAIVYVMLGIGIALLAVPRAASLAEAARYGAVLGLVIYGVYDFTNLATLRHWPLIVVLVDVAWGTAATAVAAMLVWTVVR